MTPHTSRITLHVPRLTYHASRLIQSPLLALVAFWLLLLPPLVQPGHMTCSHDGGLYLHRIGQLDALVRQGILWPRWAPGMVLGYGYPLFNFYPALSFYPALILHRLGLSLLQSWNLALALSLLASGTTMYLWARQILGQGGAFIAALAFMLAPYQLYDVYWRGNMAESLTLPMLPLVMWAALRIAQEGRWRHVSMGALAFGAVLLMHAPAALMLSLALGAYAAMLVWSAPHRRLILFQLAAMIALGVGLAAFFVLPAFAERDQVQFWRAITPGGQNFRNHFASWRELFAPAPASDPALLNPSPPRSLGWAGSLLAAAGMIAAWLARARLSGTHKRHIAWAAIMLALLILIMLPVAEPVWSSVPLLPFIQFPWRFLGLGSMLTAWLVGAGLDALHSRLPPSTFHLPPSTFHFPLALSACAALLVAGAVTWLYPRLCPTPENHTPASSVAFEQITGLIGTTSSGEYLPVAVQAIPTASPMAEAMRAGQPVNRWQAPGARVLAWRDDGLSAELILESDAPVQVTYQAFYFPGWQACVDGQRVDVDIIPPLGLMGINAPAGRRIVTVRFENTPLRTAGELVSLIFALAIAAVFIYDIRSRPLSTFHFPPSTFHFLPFTALGLLLLALKLSVLDRYDTPLRWRRLQDGQLKGAVYASDLVIAERARLLGYAVRPGASDLIYANLYWTLDKPLQFRSTVRLLDENGLEWSYKDEADRALIGSYNRPPPSSEWPPGMYADDRHAIQILPGTPPGDYLLVVVPFDPDTLAPLPVSTGQTAPGGYPGAVIGKLNLPPSTFPLPPSPFPLATYTHTPLGDDLELIGYSQDREQAAPGDGVLLTLGWQARRPPRVDYRLRLELIAPDGQSIMQISAVLGDEYTTSHWPTGAVIRSQFLAHIPGRASSGAHTWQIALLDGGQVMAQSTLGSLQIEAPQRVWIAPAMSRQVNIRLGDWAALVGFDSPERGTPGQSLSVVLLWQALGETDQDYKTFVHLLNAEGKLAAQSDGAPAGWTRPTSGWQAGEFITDAHTLELEPGLPEGQYRLAVGMYNARGRLLLPDGSDSIELDKITISSQGH